MRIFFVLAGLCLFISPSSSDADEMDRVLGSSLRQIPNAEQLILKDPMIAGLMSASLPGLGQVYTGERKKGILFFISTVGAFGAAAGFIHPADLDLEDYDRIEYGGNADGTMSVEELQNWEDNEYADDAFGDLSTGRQVGAITSLGVGVGLYIWNIIDARKSARKHNRAVVQRRIDLGLTTVEERPGLALNVHF